MVGKKLTHDRITSPLALSLFCATVAADLAGVASRQGDTLLWLLALYPGFAVAAHAFPGSEQTDARSERSRQTTSLLRTVGYPLLALSKLTSLSPCGRSTRRPVATYRRHRRVTASQREDETRPFYVRIEE